MTKRPRRTFTPEQKAQALRLAEELGNMSQAARDLDIPAELIYRWKKQADPSVSISVRHSPRINYCRGRRMKLTHGPSKRTAEHAPGRGIGA
mgnify:CR=1 FL=1